MEELASELEILEQQLKKLIASHDALKEEVSQLRAENMSLRSEIQQKDTEINNFQNKIKISKIVDGVAVNDSDAAEIKLQINEYIKEIDKCIAHLSE